MFGLASAVSRANKWSSTPSGTQIVGLEARGVVQGRTTAKEWAVAVRYDPLEIR
jgi:hypothetical protein